MATARSRYKRNYIHILDGGPITTADYRYARELIDAGYADGRYQVSKGRDDYGTVTHVVGFQINAKGRLFMDELTTAIEKESLAYRLKLCAVWGFGVASTLIVGLVSGLGVEVLKDYLPK